MGGWSTERAIDLATRHHDGQHDRADPEIAYITHPKRVMDAVRAAGYDERHQRVAVLHDTIENTELTPQVLQEAGAPEEEVAAILSVTKRPAESNYSDRVRRAAENGIGGVVKGFDMLDNRDPERLGKLRRKEPSEAERLEKKYADGLALLDQLRPGWRRAPGGRES